MKGNAPRDGLRGGPNYTRISGAVGLETKPFLNILSDLEVGTAVRKFPGSNLLCYPERLRM